MAFRYLIYRTDFGNTIVRENPTDNSTGGTEQSVFSNDVIPEIQPLYLWRVDGVPSVVPNTDQNINDWLNNITPISPEDPVDYGTFTGYTAQTQTDLDGKVSFTIFNAYTAQTATDLDGKINIVTGATGNIGEFDASGNLIDSGFAISGLTDIYVSGMTYVGSTLTLQRTEGLSDLTVTIVSTGNTDGVVSGATLAGSILTLSRTEGLPDVTVDLSGLLTDIEGDIISLSGDVVQNTTDIQIVSGATVTNTGDIITISGDVVQNTIDIQTISGQTDTNTINISANTDAITINKNDIIYLSGQTDTKQDQLSAGAGINSSKLTNNDLIELDLNAYTAVGDIAITITGTTNAVFNDLRTIAKGLEYGSDYNVNFTTRSLVDKGYVDAVAAGLDLKESVRLASTVDIDLTLGGFGGTIDGVSVQDGWRVLVKDQTSKVENGIYVYSSGANTFARAIDFINPNVTAGAFTFVETGSTQGASGWVLITQDPVNVGTDDLDFSKFSEAGQLTGGIGIDVTNGIITFDGASVAGDSITWSGTQLNIDISTGNTLGDALANKLETSVFTTYTGVTDTRITNIENTLTTLTGDTAQLRLDIDAVSGKTDQNIIDIQAVSAVTTQNASDITFISGVTDTKLDTATFTGYTASTESNELFLVHTGGTNLNSIIAVSIDWNSSVVIGSAYSWTTGSQITINDTGDYEINYNIPFNQSGSNTDKGIGSNLILNNTTTIDNATSAGWSSKNNAAGSISLPTVLISLTAGDTLDLVGFRTASNGTATTAPNGTILIKKKDKLQ